MASTGEVKKKKKKGSSKEMSLRISHQYLTHPKNWMCFLIGGLLIKCLGSPWRRNKEIPNSTICIATYNILLQNTGLSSDWFTIESKKVPLSFPNQISSITPFPTTKGKGWLQWSFAQTLMMTKRKSLHCHLVPSWIFKRVPGSRTFLISSGSQLIKKEWS